MSSSSLRVPKTKGFLLCQVLPVASHVPLLQVSLWLLLSLTVLPDLSRSGPCSSGRAPGGPRRMDVYVWSSAPWMAMSHFYNP